MSTQQDLNDMFEKKMRGETFFSEYDLQTLKTDFINEPFGNATPLEEEMIQQVRYALYNQDRIALDYDIIWKCYLEYFFLTDTITAEKLYSKIFLSYRRLPKRSVKPVAKPVVKLSELEEFEQVCKNKDVDVKKKYYALAQKYKENEAKFKELNNIKNKYW